MEGFKCVLCKEHKLGWGSKKQFGNNPYPLAEYGECCDDCNKDVVAARISLIKK